MKIAPPRLRRLAYFVIYTILCVLSTAQLFKPPAPIVHILGGVILVYAFVGFIILGTLIGMFTVLPGVWVFERVALVSISFGVMMYAVVLLFLGASPLVLGLPLIIMLFMFIRWLDIKDYLLAPREG
jgi:hypothetical protein